LPRLARARVLRGLGRREVRVGSLEPAGERRRVECGAELAEQVVTVADLPEEEVAVGTDSCARVGPQVLEAGHERLDRLGERILARGALLDRQAAPRGIEAIEGVGDVLAVVLHGPQASRWPACRP